MKKGYFVLENRQNIQQNFLENAGLSNIVNKIQVTLNEKWESFHDTRRQDLEELADKLTRSRNKDNFYLAINSLFVIVGVLLVLAAIIMFGKWLKNKCIRARTLKKNKEKDMAELRNTLAEMSNLKDRLKALEEGGDDDDEK